MWARIYWAALAIAGIVAGFFAYYAWSWLGSVGDPRVAWEAFNYHKRMGVYFVVCAVVVLIAIGNVILWNTRNAWGLWVSHAYFVICTLAFLIWLQGSGITFCLENRVCTDPSRAIGPLLAVFGSLGLTALLFADQFLLLRLQEKMHGKAGSEAPGDAADEEKESSRPN
jgi:hypothetical protein